VAFRIQKGFDYVLTILGDNSITVEITKEDLQQALFFVINTYNKYRPKVFTDVLTLVKGKQDYVLPYEKVFRGIIDVVPEDTLNSVVIPFPREYYPWVGISSINVHSLSEWFAYSRGFKGVLGAGNLWYYDKDRQVLKILREDISQVKYTYIQDRYVLKIEDFVNGNTFVKVLNDGVRRLYNVVPGSIFVEFDGKVYVSDENGVIKDYNGVIIGHFDFVTSTLNLSFSSTYNNKPIIIEVNELRESDFQWISRYLLGQLANILVSKRTRFGGKLSNTDLGDVTMDVDVLTRYAEEIKNLEEVAKKWAWEWTMPRMK
jgi:hypothetical protein